MSTIGQFNSKNPTIKRILKEARELSTSPSPDYHASPLESNLFEWHFTIRGPPAPSPFERGIYHGRIVLPNTYPLRPPSFRFTTPTGRFEVNREICLSISGHHEETWQPAWGVRTALVAIRSFMDSDAKGQLGGLDASESVRRRLAEESRTWRCAACGAKSNDDIMREQQAACEAAGAESRPREEAVPDELRLGYRDDMAKQEPAGATAAASADADAAKRTGEHAPVAGRTESAATAAIGGISSASAVSSVNNNAQASSQQQQQQPPTVQQQQQHTTTTRSMPSWVDNAIIGICIALVILLVRRVIWLTS